MKDIYVTPWEQITQSNFPELVKFQSRLDAIVEFCEDVETALMEYEDNGTTSNITIPGIRRRKLELRNLLSVFSSWDPIPHMLIHPLRELYLQLGLAEHQTRVFLGGGG